MVVISCLETDCTPHWFLKLHLCRSWHRAWMEEELRTTKKGTKSLITLGRGFISFKEYIPYQVISHLLILNFNQFSKMRNNGSCHMSHVMMRNPFKTTYRLLLAAFLNTHKASEPMTMKIQHDCFFPHVLIAVNTHNNKSCICAYFYHHENIQADISSNSFHTHLKLTEK